MTKEEKQRAVELLTKRYKECMYELDGISARLSAYIYHITNQPELHNAYEILGALKFLRLLNTYETDIETFRDVIYKYEGIWEQREGLWHHVEGGLKHPGTT